MYPQSLSKYCQTVTLVLEKTEIIPQRINEPVGSQNFHKNDRTMKDGKTYYRKISSPIGQIYITADNNHLLTITFADTWQDVADSEDECIVGSNPIIQQTERQLWEYFALRRTTFDLPITLTGTEFQHKTWQFLLGIPYGETRSYSQQARAIGHPKAVRAVGRANGLNPIAIVVPCHRVIGKSGRLTGYAGGLARKKFLLALERNNR